LRDRVGTPELVPKKVICTGLPFNLVQGKEITSHPYGTQPQLQNSFVGSNNLPKATGTRITSSSSTALTQLCCKQGRSIGINLSKGVQSWNKSIGMFYRAKEKSI
jgi:hypothetical protein